jgi:hypothetical protein
MWTAAIYRRFAFGWDAALRLDSGGPALKPQSGAEAPQSIFPGPPPVDRSRTFGMLEYWVAVEEKFQYPQSG